MENFDLIYLIITIVVIGASYMFLFVKRSSSKPRHTQEPQNIEQRQQHQLPQQNQRQPVRRQANLDSSDEDGDDDDNPQNLGARDLQKQADKEAKRQRKREQAEWMKKQYEAKEKKKSEKVNIYEERERQREEEERKAEEWKQKIAEEQKQKEQEDFEKWKDMFTVEESGKGKLSPEEELLQLQKLLEKFVKYIKLRKVVQLEDLSSEFNMKTQEVIDRIKSLEMNNQLNGLIDERGKYIYLTEQELHSVKNFIEAKGRVTKDELVRECNQLIKLDPSAQDNKELADEEKELLDQVEKQILDLKD